MDNINVKCQKSKVKGIRWNADDGLEVEYNLKKGDWIIYFDLTKVHQKVTSQINLVEKGSSVKIFGLFRGDKNNSIEWDLKVMHKKDLTKANVLIKGILDDQSTTHFNGLLGVEKKLSNVESVLRHHTVLLSDQAKALVIPSLEIKSDDAQITHASTISKLDEEQLFYLCSRNYSYHEAKRVLVEGFLKEVTPDTNVTN